MNLAAFKTDMRDGTGIRFFNSKLFVWLLALVIYICWLTGGWIAGIIIIAVLAGLILATSRDTLTVLSFLWLFLFVIGADRHKLQGFAPLLSAIIFIVLGIIINLIRFRPSFKFLKYKNVKSTTVASLAFFLSVALGGLFVGGRQAIPALVIVGLALLLSFGYLFFNATVDRGEDGKRVLQYLLFLMFVSGVLISLQVITYYIKLGSFDAVLTSFKHKTTNLGWGSTNNYSIILGMMLPSTLYYALKYGRASVAFIALSVVQFFIILLSGSRGAILFTGLTFPVMLGYVVVKSEHRAQVVVSLIIIIDIALLLLMANGKKFGSALMVMLNKELDGTGRSTLYDMAIELFKWQPIFGAGLDYNLGGLAHDGYSPFWYHSTFFQVLGCCGIVGFIAWVNLEISRYRAFLTKYNAEKLFVLGGMFIFEMYALVDVFYFTPNGLIFLLIMTLAVEKAMPDGTGRPLSFIATEKYVAKKKTQKACETPNVGEIPPSEQDK